MTQDILTISGSRANLTYNLPIEKETIRAIDLRQIKRRPEDHSSISLRTFFSRQVADVI